MSEYNHRMSLVVPELLMPQANQLALIAGESPADVHTFTDTPYQDELGNLYSVCSTVIKPIVLTMLNTPIVDGVLQAEGSDVSLAQQAMDAAVLFDGVMKATPNNIFIAIDVEPHLFFESLGLTPVATTNDLIDVV